MTLAWDSAEDMAKRAMAAVFTKQGSFSVVALTDNAGAADTGGGAGGGRGGGGGSAWCCGCGRNRRPRGPLPPRSRRLSASDLRPPPASGTASTGSGAGSRQSPSAYSDPHSSSSRTPPHPHPLRFVDLQLDYPRFPGVEDIRLEEHERALWLDLTPYLHRSPYVVYASGPAMRAYALLRTMGLRHLPVIDERNRPVGIITRHDLTRGMLLQVAGEVQQAGGGLAAEPDAAGEAGCGEWQHRRSLGGSGGGGGGGGCGGGGDGRAGESPPRRQQRQAAAPKGALSPGRADAVRGPTVVHEAAAGTTPNSSRSAQNSNILGWEAESDDGDWSDAT
jgi:CBS domain-containing protein